MKILIITNLYPPCHIGGYELGCMEIALGLETKGHDIRILTSDHLSDTCNKEEGIARELRINFPWQKHADESRRGDLFSLLASNQVVLKKMLHEYNPDVVYAWNMQGLHPRLLFDAQECGCPILYYISGYWLADVPRLLRRKWSSESWSQRLFGRIMCAGAEKKLDLRHTQFTSQFVKQRTLDAGLRCADGRIIHWGVDLDNFPFSLRPGKHTRLLYVGQLVPHKGVLTAIQALHVIHQKAGFEDVTLTLLGGTVLPSYKEELLSTVARLGLEPYVRFEGEFDRDELPSRYASHDILVFPSIWDEPFSITLLEALASGLAVVGTDTGGSSEILTDDKNAMIFAKEDASSCAAKIMRLVADPVLFERLAREGRACVAEKYTMEFMLKQIDEHINDAARGEGVCVGVPDAMNDAH